MIYNFRETQIFYKFVNKKSDTTNVYLHGWGCDHKSLLFCQEYLQEQNSLYVDFPPFGASEKDIKDWTIFTYANMVISLCNHLKLQKLNLIGHSFGGRVAIIVAVLCKEKINKVVLVDSAGLKPKRSLTYYFKVAKYKVRKKFGMDVSNFGSCDYLALGRNMRKIFSSVVCTHLDDFLPFIRAKTLIIYGKNDKITPLYMAKKLHRKIKKSKLEILEDAGHFSFVDRRVEFLALVTEFLKN
jgi:pimeloyl-ACP methyl ester carboxylesterase